MLQKKYENRISAIGLEISSVNPWPVNVNIVPSQDDDIHWTILAGMDVHNNMKWRVDDGVLKIQYYGPGQTTGGSVASDESASEGRIVIHGDSTDTMNVTGDGNTVVSGAASAASEHLPTIEVCVPVGTALSFDNIVRGRVAIEVTVGKLVIKATHQASDVCYAIAQAGDTKLNIHGSCQVEIGEINGNMTVNMRGQSRVSISKGTVSNLECTVTDGSEFNLLGQTARATGYVAKNGIVRLKRITGTQTIKQTGDGQVIIG